MIEVSSNGRSVVIRDAPGVAIPAICVVCGEPATELIGYTQDHVPVTLPGIAFLRWADVKVPYCERHSAAFKGRFKVLRIAQGLLYVLVMAAGALTMFAPLRAQLGLAREPGVPSFAIAGTLFLVLAATLFVVKPMLYDVFIRQTPRGVRITCKYPRFIEALARSNGDQHH